MHLISATIRNYRIHRERTIEFDRSRALIGGPNETGKSTLIEAIHRALFLRSKTGGEIQKGMISNLPGTTGQPEVEVIFHAGGGDYHLSKRFSGGQNGTTKLAEVDGETWTGEDAESRLASLLGLDALVGGQGAANKLAQQWAHLWVWQGKSGEDPCVHAGSEHATLLQRLQATGGAAAIQSACDNDVASHFARAVADIFGQSGKKPKKGSDLEKAETAVAAAEGSRVQAAERIERLRQAVTTFEHASATIQQTKTDLQSLEKQRAEVGEKLSRVETLSALQNTQAAEATNAAEKHQALKKAYDQIGDLREKIGASEAELVPKKAAVTQAEETVVQARQQAEKAERDYGVGIDRTRTARFRREWAAASVQLLEKKAIVEQLVLKAAQIRKRQEKLKGLRKELAKIPAIDARKLQKLQTLDTDVAKAEAALSAMAAGVEVITADAPVTIGEKTFAAGGSQIVTETTEISFGGSLRLRIRPGGGDSLAAARKSSAEAKRKLQQSLDELGLESVLKAGEAFAQRAEIQGFIDQEETALQGMDAEKAPGLLAAAQEDQTSAQAEVDRRREQVPDATPPADRATARETLAGEEGILRAAESAEIDLKALRDAGQKGLQGAEAELTRLRQSIERETSELNGYQAQLRLLLENHGDDAARSLALNHALAARTNSETALKETRAGLAQLQPEILEVDRKRFQRAWDELGRQQQEAQNKQTEARVELRSDGSADPEGDLAHAEAKLESARRQLEGVRRKADAIQMLDTLFTEVQQALADHFTQPLVERISGYLQCLFGPDARAVVTLGEGAFTAMQLVRSGSGTGAMPFMNLSGGAREQVAAAVRLAMAEVLAGDHGGCLPVVFDDAFAYSDPVRVQTLQRMLDLAADRGLQVIVLTCNPSDYIGLGARQILLTAPKTIVGASTSLPISAPDPEGNANLTEQATSSDFAPTVTAYHRE
jgi:DNA repair exonuclease SbcCD ATPase subunit